MLVGCQSESDVLNDSESLIEVESLVDSDSTVLCEPLILIEVESLLILSDVDNDETHRCFYGMFCWHIDIDVDIDVLKEPDALVLVDWLCNIK